MSEKDLASGSDIVRESAKKRKKKEKLNTTPSLKYSKTESLPFFSLANILSSCKYSGYH